MKSVVRVCFLVGSLVSLLADVSFAADDCRWYEIFCQPSAAVEDLGDSVEKASENVYSAVNFWAQIIQWFHAGTPEQKEKARQILQGVFGMTQAPSGEFSWEVRLMFRGIDTSKHPLRVILMTDYNELTPDQLAAQIRAGQRVELNPQNVVGTEPASPADPSAYVRDISAIEADIATAALPVVKAIFSNNSISTLGCGYPGQRPNVGNRANYLKCLETNASATLAKAVVKLADKRVDLRADQPFASTPWLGQAYITIVVPDQDLAAQPSLEMELTIHAKGNVDAVLPTFAKNPREVPRARLAASPAFTSPDPTYGSVYRAFTLKLHDFAGLPK